MYKNRSFLLLSLVAALTVLSGCPKDPPGNGNVDCLQNPTDPTCPIDCVNFPTLPTSIDRCKDCSLEPNSSLCNCASDILGDCCQRDPADSACGPSEDNPHPDGGGPGDTGIPCAPAGNEFCGVQTDDGFDNDCNGIADDGCECDPVAEDERLSCYTGPPGTRGVGTCADGVALCVAITSEGLPTWGECQGQTTPLGSDDCNPPRDTNCNGLVGDGCTALTVTCPGEIFSAPLDTEFLTATAIPSVGNITSTVWSITTKPTGSTTSLTTPNTTSTSIFLDVAGDYILTFTAQDQGNQTGTCSTVIHAVPTENLRIELSWNNASDIDSHLLHPTAPTWYHSVLDCMYINCDGGGVAWPLAGTGDDPRLDIDDTNGFGPENINIDFPEVNTNTGYRFGAYNFSDHGSGPADITVRIFCGGIVKAQLTHLDLIGSSTDSPPNQLWKVADIFFNTTTDCDVLPIDQVTAMGSGGVPR